jgi:hypothetical protein
MAKNLTVRLDDELAADAQALARAEGTSLNETVKTALKEAVERRRKDPKFKAGSGASSKKTASCSSGSLSDGRITRPTREESSTSGWQQAGGVGRPPGLHRNQRLELGAGAGHR